MCLPLRERREHADAAGRDVVRRQLQRRELERLEIGLRAAVGRERDRLAVGRPRRLDVGVAVVRQLADRLGLEVEQVQIADAAGLTGERERRAVRRPRHVTHRADARQLDAPLDVRRLRVEDRDLVRALGVHDERELAAVRRPVAGRVDEADRVEVRIARRTAELLDDLAGRGVADEQVDAEQILRLEKNANSLPSGLIVGARL